MSIDGPNLLATWVPRLRSISAARYEAHGVSLAVAAVLGLAMPPLAMPAAAAPVTVTLCGGGVIHLALGGKGVPEDRSGGCHAACALRRDEDDREGAGTPA